VKDYDINLIYFNKNNKSINIIDTKQRGEDNVKSSYDLVENQFEYITVNYFGYSNSIIPIWKKQNAANEKFTFAVDFGTTNTHIEYQIGNSLAKPFEINENDIQFESTISSKSTKGGTPLFISRSIELEIMPFGYTNLVGSKS